MQFLSKILILCCFFTLTSCLELLDSAKDPKEVFTPPPVKLQKKSSKNGMRSTEAEEIPIGNFTTKFTIDFPKAKPHKKLATIKPEAKPKIKHKPVEPPKILAVVKNEEQEVIAPVTEIEEKVIEEPKPIPAAKPEIELTDEELKGLESMLDKKPEKVAEAPKEEKKVERNPIVEEPKKVDDKEVEGFKYVEMQKREVSSEPEPKPVVEEPFGCTLTAIQPDIDFGEEADLKLELFGHPDSYEVINPAEEGGPKEYRDTDKQRFYYVGMVTKNGKTEWCSTQIYVHYKNEPETDWFEVKQTELFINGKNKDVAIQLEETKDVLTVTLFELNKNDGLEIGKEIEKKMYSKEVIEKIKIKKKKNFSRVFISDEASSTDHTPIEFY